MKKARACPELKQPLAASLDDPHIVVVARFKLAITSLIAS